LGHGNSHSKSLHTDNHSHGSHVDDTPLGILDVVAAALIFSALAWVAIRVAGPEGYGFLKGLLTEKRSNEFLISGFLFIAVWYALSGMVLKPYLEAFYERERQTSGTLERSVSLRKEIEKTNTELSAELMTARLEGVRKRDQKVMEAKVQTAEIVAEGRARSEAEWQRESMRLSREREELLGAVSAESVSLSEVVYSKVLHADKSATSIH